MSENQDQTKMKVPTFEELSDFVKAALERVAKEQGFIDFQFDCEAGANAGDGYMGIMLRTKIQGTKLGNSNKQETLNVIVKLPPMSKARREQYLSTPAFKREIYMYTEYFPLLMQFQSEKGIAIQDGFNHFPKCYYGDMDQESGEAAIIMEDLRESGYRMANRFKPLELPYIELTLKNIARFHALSFALKNQKPEIFEKFKFDELMSKFFQSSGSEDLWIKYVDIAENVLSADQESIKEKLNKFKYNFSNELAKLLNGTASEPYSILIHGDCWCNNLLFHHEDNTPTNIRFLDYQIACYASPVIDLVYFIFSSTDKAFRVQYYEELLKIYYNSLSQLLEELGENPDQLFPYEAFQQQLKQFGSYGMLMAFMLLPTMAVESHEIPDLDECSELIEQARSDGKTEMPEEVKKMFHKFTEFVGPMEIRMRDVIVDMDCLDYI